MVEILFESLLATILSISLYFVLLKYKTKEINNHIGWKFFLYGFSLILFGMLLDITDNFSFLDKYIFIGDTPYQSFLKKFIGYLLGFSFIATVLFPLPLKLYLVEDSGFSLSFR